MKVISGVYEMGIGYSDNDENPVIAGTLILPKGSYYEMTEINAWHYVRPLDTPSFSLMITGVPWDQKAPKSSYQLRSLDDDERRVIFDEFKKSYR